MRGHPRGHARPPTSTANYASSTEPFFLRGFRGRGFPGLPAVPGSLLDGKEGVDGSSPSEGFSFLPAQRRFMFSCWATTCCLGVHRASTRWTSVPFLY